MAILNYTTRIASQKTIGEIMSILQAHRATKIIVDYKDGLAVAISFAVEWNGALVAFTLPCKFAGILNAMRKAKVPKSYQTEEQAIRVGWRILKDWIAAQMAIVEAELAEVAEVFLPYAIYKNGDRFFDYLSKQANDSIFLEGPKG